MTRVDDVQAITALLHEYGRLLDDGDLERVAALFTRAEVRSTGDDRVRRGASEVRELYDPVILYVRKACAILPVAGCARSADAGSPA